MIPHPLFSRFSSTLLSTDNHQAHITTVLNFHSEIKHLLPDAPTQITEFIPPFWFHITDTEGLTPKEVTLRIWFRTVLSITLYNCHELSIHATTTSSTDDFYCSDTLVRDYEQRTLLQSLENFLQRCTTRLDYEVNDLPFSPKEIEKERQFLAWMMTTTERERDIYLCRWHQTSPFPRYLNQAYLSQSGLLTLQGWSEWLRFTFIQRRFSDLDIVHQHLQTFFFSAHQTSYLAILLFCDTLRFIGQHYAPNLEPDFSDLDALLPFTTYDEQTLLSLSNTLFSHFSGKHATIMQITNPKQDYLFNDLPSQRPKVLKGYQDYLYKTFISSTAKPTLALDPNQPIFDKEEASALFGISTSNFDTYRRVQNIGGHKVPHSKKKFFTLRELQTIATHQPQLKLNLNHDIYQKIQLQHGKPIK